MEPSKLETEMMGCEHATPVEEVLADGKLVDRLEAQRPLVALASRCSQPTRAVEDVVDIWEECSHCHLGKQAYREEGVFAAVGGC